MEQIETEYLTIKQAATILSITELSVRRLLKAGAFPYVNVAPPGYKREFPRINKKVFQDWIENNTKK